MTALRHHRSRTGQLAAPDWRASAGRIAGVVIVAGWVLAGSSARAEARGPVRARAQPVLLDLREVFEEALADFEEGLQVQAENPDRARRRFRLAVQGFETIAAAGVVNGRLEFNLGNSYLQAGDLGRAILHYRRAQRLIPGDDLLEGNLKVAQSRCLTTIRPTRRNAFLRSVFFWHYDTSVAGRAKAAIVLYAAFWVLLAARNFMPGKALTTLLIGCAVMAVALGASVAVDDLLDRNAPGGVVTAMDVVVQKGPGLAYQRQFEQPLQPGVEFTLRRRRGDWLSIELPDGQIGWIETAAVELVPTERFQPG